MAARLPANLYLHFPFCRRKCAYCALESRAGASEAERAEYAAHLASRVSEEFSGRWRGAVLSTVYFGGGSPALCDLAPLFRVLAPLLAPDAEFSVELHPLDATPQLLAELRSGGVNRVSMGVQSLDDSVLAAMGRGYCADEARAAFERAASVFPNAGIDLIVGWPGDKSDYRALATWPLAHVSAYSLIREERTALDALVRRGRLALPDDDEVLDRLAALSELLAECGFRRYEISNYARPGRECRHNLATWRGEDYIGLGRGAAGRIGLERTLDGETVETLSPEADRLERAIFRLRTREGLDASLFPQWRSRLDAFVREGILDGGFPIYRLTPRGTEVCDSILSELV